MKKSHAIVALATVLAIAAASNTAMAESSETLEWNSDVKDFEVRDLFVPEGRHLLIIRSDSPVMECGVFKNAQHIEGMRHESSICCITLFVQSKRGEKLKLLVFSSPKVWVVPIPFKYHAALL